MLRLTLSESLEKPSVSVTDLSESGITPSAGHSESRELSCSGDIEGFGLRDLHHRLHQSSTNLTEDSCNFQARCMATRPLPVQDQIKFLSEAGLPSRPHTEPARVPQRTYLMKYEAHLVEGWKLMAER